VAPARARKPSGPATSRVVAVVLAAGTSTRMGRPKALVEVGGRPMLERTLQNLRAAHLASIVVVLGSDAPEVRRRVDLQGVTVVENPGFAEGLGSSLRVGVHAVPRGTRFVMVVLGDQPFIDPATLAALARRAEAGDGRILIPTYKGVRGNPVTFDATLAPEVERIHGDVGCRAMFPDHPHELREVPVDDPGVLVDIDTEAELTAAESALASGSSGRAVLDRLTQPRWALHASPSEHPEPRRLRRRPDVAAIAQGLRSQGVPFALATVVRVVRPTSGRPGYQAIIREDGSHLGWVGGACTADLLVAEARAAMVAGEPRLLRVTPGAGLGVVEEGVVERAMTCQSGGTVEIFIEPNLPKPTLLIVGDSPVATSLATLGPVLGYRVALVAPGADPTEMPEVDEFVGKLEDLAKHLGPNTYAIVASMGKYDEPALTPIARGPAAFAGLVASRKRAESVFAALREDGVAEAEIARVRNPVGLDIAASTPEEIALSILAELTRVRRTVPRPAEPDATASRAAPVAIDPVCHMEVETTSPLHAAHAGTTYYFCSDACRRKFVRTPAKFLA
jgi:xanthine dehydrogenase accessory factor